MAEASRPDLRQRHTALTRETILRALVDVISEGGLAGFSVQEVADRAGVSHRTVYRYYPSRDDLLAGLVEWVESRMVELGAPFSAEDAGELADSVRANMAVFDELADGVEAMTRFSFGTGIEPARRDERTVMFTNIAERELRGCDPEQVRAVAALVRLLVSTRAWLTLRQDGVMPHEHTGPAIAWAVEVLLEAAKAGRGPELRASRDPRGGSGRAR